VKKISTPFTKKNSWFVVCQESYKKDVEQTFGVMDARFTIATYPSLTWSTSHIWEVCVIINNMIIESERSTQSTV
jgi:hypothetical protein